MASSTLSVLRAYYVMTAKSMHLALCASSMRYCLTRCGFAMTAVSIRDVIDMTFLLYTRDSTRQHCEYGVIE